MRSRRGQWYVLFLRRFICVGYIILPYADFAKTTGSPWLLLANSVIQGYEVTHRDIELLKLRNFTIGTKIDDSVLSSDDAQVKIKETMRGLENFVCLSMLAATSSCHSTASIWKLTC